MVKTLGFLSETQGDIIHTLGEWRSISALFPWKFPWRQPKSVPSYLRVDQFYTVTYPPDNSQILSHFQVCRVRFRPKKRYRNVSSTNSPNFSASKKSIEFPSLWTRHIVKCLGWTGSWSYAFSVGKGTVHSVWTHGASRALSLCCVNIVEGIRKLKQMKSSLSQMKVVCALTKEPKTTWMFSLCVKFDPMS